ncbi:radical SAM protein [archaeon]|nr:radical SAM protein [archaeon]MBT4022802.1 radical SAM protein [archaeon]MBT4273004.1 radical SAM protein [archaeon]MBT4460905.1 radical SAM protein [archaeon]MBT4858121.1 radical SAM protein [archaeon]
MKKKVVLMVNDKDACNIACKKCYLPFQGVKSAEDTIRDVETLHSLGFDVTIAGSETLMDTNYLDAYQKAGQDYILTNGLLLLQNSKYFGLLKEHGINTLQISADFGVQSDMSSVPLTLVERVVKLAVERDFQVRLTTLITEKNYQDVLSMCKQAYEMGAQEIRFLRYLELGSGANHPEFSLDKEQILQFFDLVQETRSIYSQEELNIKIHGNFGPRQGSKGEDLSLQNSYCPAGESLFVITPNNKIYGCPFLIKDQELGHFTNGELKLDRELDHSRANCLTYSLEV